MLFFTGAGARPLSGHAAMAAAALALNHGLVTPRTPDLLQIDSESGAVSVARRRARRPTARPGRAVRGAAGRGVAWQRARHDEPAHRARGRRVVGKRGRRDRRRRSRRRAAIVEPHAGASTSGARAHHDARRDADADAARVTATAVPVTACAFVGPATDLNADVRSVLVRSDGSVGRSPSVSGTAAVSVVLAAMGLLAAGRRLPARKPLRDVVDRRGDAEPARPCRR